MQHYAGLIGIRIGVWMVRIGVWMVRIGVLMVKCKRWKWMLVGVSKRRIEEVEIQCK